MDHMLPSPGIAVAVAAVAVLVAGCGAPPDLAPTPEIPLPRPTTPAVPSTPGPSLPGPTPTSTADSSVAVSCDGRPDGNQVLSLLQAEDVLPDGTEATIADGPLCAGDWQLTVVRVPDLDPLQVITSGPADDLTLVTAGTEVCTIEVLVHAPPGIRSAAGCVG